mgnify:CR=1 FL=1
MDFGKLKNKNSAKAIALVGIMAATVECGKLALSFLPNIEVVTLLLALFGYVFGWYGVLAAVVFVCIEPLIWGFGSWVLTYIIYWPLVAFAFMLLHRVKVKNRWLLTASAVGLTVFFGILSSLIDTAFYLGINEYYFSNFLMFYMRGAVFYVVQLACNIALFSALFPYLSGKLSRIRQGLRL